MKLGTQSRNEIIEASSLLFDRKLDRHSDISATRREAGCLNDVVSATSTREADPVQWLWARARHLPFELTFESWKEFFWKKPLTAFIPRAKQGPDKRGDLFKVTWPGAELGLAPAFGL